MATQHDSAAVASRIEALLADIEAAGDPALRDAAEELVRTLMEFYGAGLTRLVDLVHEAGDDVGGELLRRFAADELVSGLLILHDLHPAGVQDRVLAALAKVRPYLGSHAGDVEYLGIDEAGVLRLRLAGSCDGCPSSTVTVKLAIEQAVHELAPEITGIDVEGVAEPESATGPGGRPLLPLISDSPVWVEVDGLSGADVAGAVVGGLPTILCTVDGVRYAYRDHCPACAGHLLGGRLSDGLLCCPGCGHCYDVRLAGRDTGPDDYHLDPLPLLARGDSVRVAVPAEAAAS